MSGSPPAPWFFGIKGVQGQECEAPRAPPAQPVHNAAFHAVADAAVCQPSGAAEPSLPTRRGPQWSLVLPSPLPEPRCLGEPSTHPPRGLARVCRRDFHARLCLLSCGRFVASDVWLGAAALSQPPRRKSPVSAEVPALSAPLTPHQLYPVTLRACYIFCLPTCPFILEKSDSALEIGLRSHLLQEVGPECLPLICVKCLFSDVRGLALVYLFVSHWIMSSPGQSLGAPAPREVTRV